MAQDPEPPEVEAEDAGEPTGEAERTAEMLLARLATYRATEAALVRQHGLEPRKARTVIARVRARWAQEEPTAERIARKRQLRAAAEDLYRDARLRQRVVAQEYVDSEGRRRTREVTIDDPDRAFCLRVLTFLAALDGLVTADLGGGASSVGVRAPDLEVRAEEVRARLEERLDAMPPDRRAEVVSALLELEQSAPGAIFVLAAKGLTEGGNGSDNVEGNGSGDDAQDVG